MEAWREELYHHGILGMKWGKKNGPPYPLGASDHSVSEKKAGWRKSLGGGSSGSSARQRYKERKRAIQDRYDKEEARIESRYKRGEYLSKKDMERQRANEKRYDDEWAKAKQQYKKERKDERAKSTKSLNPLLNQMYGRKINASYNQRKRRGESLSTVGRTRIGAIGRHVGRGILVTTGVSAVSGITHLAASQNVADAVDVILKSAAGAYGVTSLVRTYQDISDISTYKKSKRRKK